jgi:hypothetical protein
MTFVLHGYVFIGLHEVPATKLLDVYTPLSGRRSGLWSSVDLGNSRGAEKGASFGSIRKHVAPHAEACQANESGKGRPPERKACE